MSPTKTSAPTIDASRTDDQTSGQSPSGQTNALPHPNGPASGRKTSARTKRIANPLVAPSGPQTLNAQIRDAISRTREADPHVIARRLLPKLSAEDRERLILIGLVDRVAKSIAEDRTGGVSVPRRAAGPSKFSVAIQRVCVAGDWKILQDCSAVDLDTLAVQHEEISAKNLVRAKEYRDLASALRASGCATVGEMWTAKDLAA